MPEPNLTAEERAAREKAAYEEDQVWEKSNAWIVRVRHVIEQPNTQRAERIFDDLLRDAVAGGGRALDIGSADGWSSRRVLDMGAGYVHGIDVVEHWVEEAQAGAIPGKLEFSLHDAQQPIEGEFDLIFGRSVLHHIDFEEFLPRVWRDNLRPGGRIVFMEPLSHPLTLAFHKVVRSAHTPDEKPITAADLDFMARAMPGMQVVPVNLVSFPFGAASTFVFKDADNPVTRATDRIDRALERPRLKPFFRQGVITAQKPA